MARLFVGFAICLAVGALVALSGLGRFLPLEGALVPPQIPESWAAMPVEGRVDVTLVSSEALVEALAGGLSGPEVALHRRGALALVDGRIIAVSGASVRSLLRALSWERLPIEARHAKAEELSRFVAPTPASLTWRGKRRVYVGLRSGREALAAAPGFIAATLFTALLLLLRTFVRDIPALRAAEVMQPERSAWPRRRAEAPVRVVLVPDAETLSQVRAAIGEEHVIASCEHAFAFADGWILAARKGSVFELVSELGWRMRPVEMSTRAELVGEGHALSPVPSDDAAETLDVLEALHVCGPLAHGTEPRIASSALSL